MAMELKVPELGEGVESAVVAKVLVAEGDHIEVDQPVLELETDKVAAEVPSDVAGIIEKVHITPGDEVKVGQTLLTLRRAEADQNQCGDRTAAAEPEPEPDQTPGPDTCDTSDTSDESDSEDELPATQELPAPAAPSVRRFAREIGVAVDHVRGSGPNGRIGLDDVKHHAKTLLSGSVDREGQLPGSTLHIPPADPLPDFARWGTVRQEPMNKIRRTTAEQLTRCWKHVAHVTHFDRADVTELEQLRERYADRAIKAGGKLTMAVMVVKVAATALKVFPKFNASINMETKEVIYKEYINIGIAVATERGLLVPVLRDVDKKNMLGIAAEVSAIAERTRNGSIQLDELRGGTFTVTNLGNIGGTHFTPIVNWPEVAILGMGRSRVEPGFENGVCTPRVFLPLSLSYDHRLIDGAEAARFVRWIVEAIEEPLLLSLEG